MIVQNNCVELEIRYWLHLARIRFTISLQNELFTAIMYQLVFDMLFENYGFFNITYGSLTSGE